MTKERNRFDALAEELEAAEPKVEEKPPCKTSTASAAARRARQLQSYVAAEEEAKFPPPPVLEGKRVGSIKDEPQAFLSVMGRPYTVLEWRLNMSAGGDEMAFARTADRYRTSYSVYLKLPGEVPAAHLLEDPGIIFVRKMPGREDFDYMRLEVRDVKVTVTSTDRYTEVEAYGTVVL